MAWYGSLKFAQLPAEYIIAVVVETIIIWHNTLYGILRNNNGSDLVPLLSTILFSLIFYNPRVIVFTVCEVPFVFKQKSIPILSPFLFFSSFLFESLQYEVVLSPVQCWLMGWRNFTLIYMNVLIERKGCMYVVVC